MIPDNARTLRITAAAGTELAGPYSYGTVKPLHVVVFLPVKKQFTTHRAVFLHAAWLDQALAHCPIFLTAASHCSLRLLLITLFAPPPHPYPPNHILCYQYQHKNYNIT